MYKWLKRDSEPGLGLPSPKLCKSREQASLCASVNREIELALSDVNCATGRKRKRGTYEHYDDEQRAKIARYNYDHAVYLQ